MVKEKGVVDALEAWDRAGRQLRDVEPETFRQLLALARGYLSLHADELESVEVFNSRIGEILPKGSRGSA